MYEAIIINGKGKVTKTLQTDLSSPAILNLWILKHFKSKGGYAVISKDYELEYYWKLEDNFPKKYETWQYKDFAKICKILGIKI